jgi:5-methylcytosine-specific restriction endonuclease McrBC regulatory subunit McrC
MAQSSSEKSFFYKLEIKAKELYLGFSVSNGYTVAVVPRFWFPNPKEIPAMKIDQGKLIVLPDIGSRIIESSKEIEFKRFESEKENTWIQISETDVSENEKNKLAEYFEKNKFEKDMKRLEALFYTVWDRKTKSRHLLELGTGSSKFRYFLFIGIIEEINEQMRELRRSYNELRVQTSTLRGRIDFASSIPLIASGSPEMVCITEEFSIKTPHYSALMSAIDMIISTPSLSGKSMFDGFLNKLRNEASITRARFREIPSMSFGMAIRTLRSTPVPPQLKKWNQIFDFALLILEGDGVLSNSQNISTKPYQWQSSYFWEDILEKIAINANIGDVTTQNQMNDPWVKVSEIGTHQAMKDDTSDKKEDSEEQATLARAARKKPDVVISYEKQQMDLIIDAKYYSSTSKVMSSSNYQLLGYALAALHRKESNTDTPEVSASKRRVHFAVPTVPKKVDEEKEMDIVKVGKVGKDGNEKEQIWELQYPFTILAEKGNINPKLYGLEVEFPQPDVYLPDSGKNTEQDYFTKAGESLKAVMEKLDNAEKEESGSD